jgi:FKBP-type peptidyl-prolyl cis-trans isomerase
MTSISFGSLLIGAVIALAMALPARSADSAAGADFLKDNAKKEGVKTTASGLQYKVIKEGEGNSPKATDTERVH